MSHFSNKTFPRAYLNTFNITKDMCEKRDNAEIWIVVLNFFWIHVWKETRRTNIEVKERKKEGKNIKVINNKKMPKREKERKKLDGQT